MFAVKGEAKMKRVFSGMMVALILMGMFNLAFNTKPVKGEWTGTVYIKADGSVDPPTAPIQRDGSTYTFTDNIYDSIVIENDNIVVDGAGYTLQGPGAANASRGVSFFDRTDIIIKNANIKGFWSGIYFELASYNDVSGNNITDNTIGIKLIGSSNNIISGNNITNNMSGIDVGYGSSYNDISGNNITNGYYGIELYYSSNYTRISGNNIANHIFGITTHTSSYDDIFGNNLTNNEIGLSLGWSSGISIYHNNFIANTYQASIDYSDSFNLWDDGYPSGGNYWSDYTDMDLYSGPYQNETGSDGIWDHPYVIDTNNKDRYPFVNPWTPTPPPKFRIGDWVQTRANVNVREGPGLSYAIIDTMAEGTLGQILGGPVEADGYVWWDVDYVVGVRGWSAENWLERTSPPTPENQPPKKPTNVFPEDGATNINLVITLRASPFSDPDYEDTCANAQWQITTVPGDYSNTVFDEIGYTYYFNTIILPTGTLDYGNTYHWRMRYQDNHGAWSDWSDETSFTTATLSFDYSPINPFVGEQITFTVSNYPSGAICEWNFGDGSPVLREEAWRGATHSYENAGLYTVALILIDQNGKQSITSRELEISNDEVIVSLKVSNQQPKIGEEIVLDASGSHNLNPRVKITYCKWEFFDSKGAKIKEGSTNSPIIFYYWKNKGEHSVMLTVENENGLTAVTSATINVQAESFWDWSKDWFKKKPEIDEQRLDAIISSLGLNFLDKNELAAVLYKPVANKEILIGVIENKEDAVAYTYGAKVALTLGEMETVQDVLIWQANIDLTQRVDAYLPYIATLEAVKQIAMVIVDGGLEGLRWIGVIISGGREAWDVGWGVADIERAVPTLGVWKMAEYYNALRWYLELRSEGLVHLAAWNSPEVVYSLTIYTQDQRSALEPSFKHFGDTYAQYVVTSDGLKEDFMTQIKEGLRTELLYALEQYKFEPLYEQVKIKSAGELRVYDSLNRVTGLVNGQIRHEIPLSFYDEESETVVIFDPSDTYLYEVVGEDKGTYGLDITSVEYGNITIFTSTDIPISLGATHQYIIDWDALSQGEEGVTVQVDADGDGVFEQSFTSDSELTHDEFMLQTATIIDFDPDTLNLKSKGSVVTVYIEFPEGYDVADINVSTIMLNRTVPAELSPTAIGDCDNDTVPDLMVKFDRAKLISYILANVNMTQLMEERSMTVTLTITGKLKNGTPFQGSDTIKVIYMVRCGGGRFII